MNIPKTIKLHKNVIINTFMIGALAYLVIPRLNEFSQSLQDVLSAEPLWVIVATVVFFCGMPLMALQLDAISIRPLRYWVTYKVQMAALFVNKLLPSGLGLVALNTYYLRRTNHTVPQIASVISISAITSATAFISLVVVAIIVGGGLSMLDGASSRTPLFIGVGLLLVSIAAILVLWRKPAWRSKAATLWSDTARQLRTYSRRKGAIGVAIFGNGTATLTSVIALFACASALHISITLSEALIVYMLGNVIGNLIPTPGGLVGVDAGLYGGLVVVGLDSSQALSVVLLYRFITYWLAIIPGFVFFALLRRDVLADFSLKQAKQ